MERGSILLVGLGNPGDRYRNTRHNLGFQVVDRLAGEANTSVARTRGDALYATVRMDGHRVLLCKPVGYMNRSGPPVRALKDFFGVEDADLLVIYDDLDLPLGRLRFRARGGSGGHRGVQSLIQALGSDRFARLKIGIGPVPPRWDPADFVLSSFREDERPVVDEAVRDAARAVRHWLSEGTTATMNEYN